MNESVIEDKLIQWSSKCSYMLGGYFELCKPFFSQTDFSNPDLQFALYKLFLSCHLTSESVFLLISHSKVWDADIIIRAVLEGTFKFAYLCIGDENERENKRLEYAEYLPDITQLKHHQRITQLMKIIDNVDSENWRPFQDLLLEAEELNTLQSKYPGKIRSQLDQKWSFNGLSQALAEADPKKYPGFDGARAMAFNYGMSSHQVHQDYDAISIVWERLQRDETRQELIQLAHGARGLSDLISMASIRSLMCFKLFEADTKPFDNLFEHSFEFMVELTTAYQEWHNNEYK